MKYLYNEINKIRKRPGFYLGKASISALYHYVHGYTAALYELDAVKYKELMPLPFSFFHDFTSNYFDWYESTSGWCNIILTEAGLHEEKGLEQFYELFDAFLNLSIQNCFYAALTDENKKHHYTDYYAPKRVLPPDNEQTEPLYMEPAEVYMIELSNGGWLCMVNTESQHRLMRTICKSKEEAEQYLICCFGASIKWEPKYIKNIPLTKKLSY